MNEFLKIFKYTFVLVAMVSCNLTPKKQQKMKSMTASQILGNSKYLAISYGGYRKSSRDLQPTIQELKEDMRLLEASGIKVLRTYNLQLAQASNLLKAIAQIKKEDATFEMYVMLGAWIDCKDAWTPHPNHDLEDEVNNASEIEKAVQFSNQYPDIVKIIAVGNESMVKWAWSYYVQPWVVLKYVNQLQNLKEEGKLSKDVWITTSDNFASWGGGEVSYQNKDLEAIYKAVDYVSMHTYPMHDTHYNPIFWGVQPHEENDSKEDQLKGVMQRATSYAVSQYDSVKSYMKSIGVKKPIHIGETGWASASNGYYGTGKANATDEYKEALFYREMRAWTAKERMSCFYFEAFDEIWKDAENSGGSENHFGLFTIDGKAKYALWSLVDQEAYKGLSRNGNPVTKTFDGNLSDLLEQVTLPCIKELQEY